MYYIGGTTEVNFHPLLGGTGEVKCFVSVCLHLGSARESITSSSLDVVRGPHMEEKLTN